MELSNDQIKTLILALEGGFLHPSWRRLFSENFIKDVQCLLDEFSEEVGWGVESLQKKLGEVKTGRGGEGIVGWLVIVRHHSGETGELMMLPLTSKGIAEGEYMHGQDEIIGTIPNQRGDKQ